MASSCKAILAGFAFLLTAQAVEAGPIFLGREYEIVVAEGIDWEDARVAAQGLGTGWDLATIADAAENTFVESLLDTTLADRSHFWIGATDMTTEGVWQWVDGTPFVFTDWWGGEPNNAGNEDFLAYDLRSGSWAWNDASNSTAALLTRGYVAEGPAVATVPEPMSLSLFGLGVLVAEVRRRRHVRR